MKQFLLLTLLAPLAAHAGGASLPGPTGLLTVPTAEAVDEGSVNFGMNQHDSTPEYEGATNYLFNIGFAPGLEIGGRIAQPLGFKDPSDLSFNAKLQLWRGPGPRIAVGGTDLGGEARNFRSRYAVATLPWHTLRLTLGHRWSKDLAEGTLGGIEWRPWPLLGLYAEYDTQEANPGLRLQSPPLWAGLRIEANAGYHRSLDEVEGGIQFSLPLGKTPRPQARPATAPTAPRPEAPAALRHALEDLGFESVQTGRHPDGTLVVALENRRYNHSSADGVGLALGAIATRAPPDVNRIELDLSSYGAAQVTATTSAPAWREFLRDGTTAPDLLDVRYNDGADRGVTWDNTARALNGAELYVEPVLRTFVATEFGVLDAGAGVRGRLLVPLAPGLTAQLGAETPVVLTDDFEDGRNFAPFAPEPGVDLMVLQYAHKPTAGWTSLWSAGRTQVVQSDLAVYGTEQAWMSPQGAHRLSAKALHMSSSVVSHDVVLGGYTWYDASRGYSASVTAGQFYFDDRGFRFDFNRYFGDTIAGLFLKVESHDNQAGGFQLSIPLTPRRDAAPGLVQVKGLRRWSYSLQTTLNLADNSNKLKPLMLFEPRLDLDLTRDFLDSGRLTPDYLRHELPRMREAWELWDPISSGG